MRLEAAIRTWCSIQRRLISRSDAVTFLAKCEASGSRLRNCPAYIRNWIGTKERNEAPYE